tara:strand:+ start:2217 stop:2525 length:309 start_codon:yes stop_codon:yes gene_type:complete
MPQELNHAEVIDFIEARSRQHLSRKQLEVDVECYQSFLDDREFSDEDKAEFLKALWTVIAAFVDFGYGVHPVQAAGAEIISLPVARSSRNSHSSEIGGAAHV